MSNDFESLIYQADSHPLSKVKLLPNGAMHWIAPIARSTLATEKGLPYLDKQGKLYYQQVDANLLAKTIDTFKGIPTTLGHPEGSKVTPKNAREYMRGMTSTGSVTPQTDTHIWMCGTNIDEELIKEIVESRARQISPGYGVKLAQTDQADVMRQVDRLGNHIAFLPMGRNGKTVALNIDDGSELAWDYYSEAQIDSDYLTLLQREVLDLPRGFLDFEYIQKDQIDLTPHIDNIDTKKEDISNMKTYQIVGKNGQVLTFQADSDDVTAYIASLRTDLEAKTIEATNAKANDQNDAALNTEIDRLKAELETAKLQIPEQQNDAAMNEQVIKVATSLFKVVPEIYKVDPNFNLDALDVPLTEHELKRQYLIAVNPAKKADLMALKFQGDSAIRDAAYVDGVYEATVNLRSSQIQNDVKPDVPTFMSQFRDAIKSAVPQPIQTDKAQTEAQRKAAEAEESNRIDNNF